MPSELDLLLQRIDRIKTLAERLGRSRNDVAEAQDLVERIRREADAVRDSIMLPKRDDLNP